MADRLSVPPSEIRAIERGEKPIDPSVIEKAVALLELSPAAANQNDGFSWPETAPRGLRSPRIGAAIRDRRIALGLSRSALSDFIGSEEAHVAAIEEGRAPLDIAALFGLAVALQTSPEDLYHKAVDHPGVEHLLEHSNVLMTLLDSLKAKAR